MVLMIRFMLVVLNRLANNGHLFHHLCTKDIAGEMNKRQLILSLALLAVFLYPSLALSGNDAIEADSHFTYKGKPIHPFLVKEFSNWISDNRPPVVTTIDVATAFDTNEYQQDTIEKRGDWWFAKAEEKDGDVVLYEEFGYRWLGKLGNGVHVLETGAGGGGSGFFEDLMFIKFSEGEILWEGKKEKQLLMTITGSYSLGDRYEGKIKVYPGKVVIPASKSQAGGGSGDVELTFP